MVRQLSLLALFCAATVTLAALGVSRWNSPAICQASEDNEVADRSQVIEDRLESIRQRRLRRQLILDRVLVVVLGRDGRPSPAVVGPFGEPGYYELLYLPDWENEGNVAAFTVLVGERLGRRLSEEDVSWIRALFPEARVRSFEEACRPDDFGLGPCYCPFAGHRDLTFPQGLQFGLPR